MKKSALMIALALGWSAMAVHAQDPSPSPSPSGERPPMHEGGHGGPHKGGLHLLPPGAEEQLNLTADQRKQISDLEAETKAKLEKILTPEQLEKLKQMRPPHHPEQGKPDR